MNPYRENARPESDGFALFIERAVFWSEVGLSFALGWALAYGLLNG